MPQRTVASPIGAIRIVSADGMIASIAIAAERQPDIAGDDALLTRAADQLIEYFAGTRRQFDLPVLPSPSPRGEALRTAIVDIGYGTTATYGALAIAVASGARAIGQACARNPLPLLIPCHRVLASNGLGHYSAGAGAQTKRWLLAHEAGDLWAR